jgi:hypothetical protein
MRSGAAAGSGQSREPAVQGDSAASALTGALTGAGSGGLGILLPLLLVVAALAAVGLLAMRLRSHTEPPDVSV